MESMADERDMQLISASWPQKHLDDKDANEEMDWLVQMISTIRTTRSELNVPGSVKLNVFLHGASDVTAQRLERNFDLIQRMARLDKVELVDQPVATGCVQEVVGEATVFIMWLTIWMLRQKKPVWKKKSPIWIKSSAGKRRSFPMKIYQQCT